MDILCSRCRKPILGEARRFVNEETDMVFFQHIPCWRKTYYESLYATLVVIRKVKGGQDERNEMRLLPPTIQGR